MMNYFRCLAVCENFNLLQLRSNLFVTLSLVPAYSLIISRPAISLPHFKNAFQRSYPQNFAVFFLTKFENVQLKSDVLSSVAEHIFFCRTRIIFGDPRLFADPRFFLQIRDYLQNRDFFCRAEIFLQIHDFFADPRLFAEPRFFCRTEIFLQIQMFFCRSKIFADLRFFADPRFFCRSKMAALSAVKNKKAAKMREGDLRIFLVPSYFKTFLYVLSCLFLEFWLADAQVRRRENEFLFFIKQGGAEGSREKV